MDWKKERGDIKRGNGKEKKERERIQSLKGDRGRMRKKFQILLRMKGDYGLK